MDIVICTSTNDCLIARKAIRLLRKNIEAGQIYILTCPANFIFFGKRFLRNYGVTLVDESEIIDGRERLESACKGHFSCEYRFGWYLQQFLKMGFALSRHARENYLIWDADTMLLNPIALTKDGKYLFTAKTEHHKAYFQTIKKAARIWQGSPILVHS